MDTDVVEKLIAEVIIKSQFAKKLEVEVCKELDKMTGYGDKGIVSRAINEKLHEVAVKLLCVEPLSKQIETKVQEFLTKEVINLAAQKTTENIIAAMERQMRGY